MNLGELITVFRREVLDSVQPYLWSDAEVAEFASDAVLEAVRRGFQIIDSSDAEICQLPYAIGQNVLELDPRVIAIRSAIVRGQMPALDRMKVGRMDLVWPGWRDHTGQRPVAYIDDWGSYQLRIYPTPTAAGVIDLSVAREPLAPLTDSADVPELPARYHRSLVNFMCFRAYSKNDTEVNDVVLARMYEQRFVAEFGERKSARNEKWMEEQAGVMYDTLA